MDGVNTTGVEYGFQGKELNFEFIEAVDVKTGGYEAELGRATGGIINVITKSGGNEFHGDIFGYYDSDSLQNSADEVVATSGTVSGYTRADYGIGLGGYIVKDKLWFFGAYDRVSNSRTMSCPGGHARERPSSPRAIATWAPPSSPSGSSDSQSIVGTFFQDPRDDTGAVNDAQHTLNGEPSTYEGIRSFGGRDYALRYEGVVGSNWVFSLQGALHQEENSVGPATAEGDSIQYRTVGETTSSRRAASA